MAKLGKEKFNIGGHHVKDRTTYSGQVELYLHYNNEGHYFYFEAKELQKYFSKSSTENISFFSFSSCDTRQKAIQLVQALLNESSIKTRMLRIELGMNSELYNIPNPIKKGIFDEDFIFDPQYPDYLRDMVSRYNSNRPGLTVDFYRIIKLESNGFALYANCNEQWEYELAKSSTYGFNLIEWTQEREDFIINLQAQLNELSKKVLEFFTAKTIDEFYQRLETGTKLIGK